MSETEHQSVCKTCDRTKSGTRRTGGVDELAETALPWHQASVRCLADWRSAQHRNNLAQRLRTHWQHSSSAQS